MGGYSEYLDKQFLEHLLTYYLIISRNYYIDQELLDYMKNILKSMKGKIITSTYQNFTDIHSLRKFLKWQNQYHNFECHLDLQSAYLYNLILLL